MACRCYEKRKCLDDIRCLSSVRRLLSSISECDADVTAKMNRMAGFADSIFHDMPTEELKKAFKNLNKSNAGQIAQIDSVCSRQIKVLNDKYNDYCKEDDQYHAMY